MHGKHRLRGNPQLLFGVTEASAWYKKESALLYRGRFAQVFSAVGLAAAGEAIEFGLTAYVRDLIIHPVTFQHTEMAMVIGTAAAIRIGRH